MSEPPLRVLVVDDEEPARQRLIELLREDGRVSSIRQAGNGREAMSALAESPVDLVFLDVQMPEMDGLELVGALGAGRMPLTIFVTAYDRHAIAAFEANALDYLLKPFSDERFEATMARARQRLAEAPQALERLVVKTGGRTSFLRTVEIDCIEAAGVYLTVHAGGREILQRAALSDLDGRLDPRKFVRIHRSTIVNIDSIRHLEPVSHGEFDAVLKDGRRKRVSRTYKGRLEALLRQPL